jgi:undecaprenyl-diphosphatase
LIDVAHHSSGFSFPSGHVMSAVLLWGFVVFASHAIQQRALRIGVQVFAAGMMVLMGLQRIYAGAHWPTDVLAAYLWGAIVLFAVAKLYEYVKARQLAPQHVVRAVAGAEA